MSPSDRTEQRTAAQREAARKERERRRAQRRGEPVADPSAAGGQEGLAAPAEAVAPAEATAEATAPAGAAAPAGDAARAEAVGQPAPVAQAATASVAGEDQPVGQATQAWDVAEHLQGAEGPAAQVEAVDPVEQPAGAEPRKAGSAARAGSAASAGSSAKRVAEGGERTQPQRRRASRRPRADAEKLPTPPPPLAGGRGKPPRSRQGRAGGGGNAGGGGHSPRARAGAIGALIVVAVAVWVVVMLIQHFGGSKSGNATALAPQVKVVIPEGMDRRQIAAIARKDGLKGSYLQASRASSALQPKRFGAPANMPNLEGFLFPATYEMAVHGNVKGLVERQLEAFQERFGEEQQKHARALGLTSYELLIVASMVEREAYLSRDRPLVAAVIYNRLRQGMPLGIDSTIRYAFNNLTGPLTEAQLKAPSPYNTRLHTGLPPTPISNPGIEAIEAAAHPAHAGYLYYVDGADGCGDLVFSNTEAEFEHDKAAYDEALAANGGRTPTCKQS